MSIFKSRLNFVATHRVLEECMNKHANYGVALLILFIRLL